jgi:60S ribosomal subunit assembly/export protein LOC1
MQVKGRPNLDGLQKKKKKRVYTDEELGIPKLNMITPVGVQKPKGQKKGKVFVDDKVSLLRQLNHTLSDGKMLSMRTI